MNKTNNDNKTNTDEDRRNARRFQISWEVAVKGTDEAGKRFDVAGTLENLSSLGALLHLPRCLNLAERLELQIKVPFKKNNWMRYTAEVVRVEQTSAGAGVGVRFDTAVPGFLMR
jgi:PilZ domain-containing protein